MSVTHIGITCKVGDAIPVLTLNSKLGIGLVRKNHSVDNFDLFSVTAEGITEQMVGKIISEFTTLNWKHPDSCVLIVESPYAHLSGVQLPDSASSSSD